MSQISGHHGGQTLLIQYHQAVAGWLSKMAAKLHAAGFNKLGSVRGDTAHVSAKRDSACQSEGVEDFIKIECLELREPWT